jgi:A/G-specific adenine glycosylase
MTCPTDGRASPRVTPRGIPRGALRGIPLGSLRAAVLAWYDQQGRSLPFRGASDPWAILVSEAMAQQTQAARAGDAWRTFMVRFPTPEALAEAAPAEVLRAWRGLGYNRRAIALQRAARRIVELHGGRVPAEPDQLEALPGVGPYTARAVAALAYGRPVGAVDTNVRRVIGRLTGGPLSPRPTQVIADALVDPDRPADWTHALMDVGAGPCRPVGPRCEACPLRPWCRTCASGGPPGTAVQRAGSPNPAPFPATTRWLRGRIVDRLRDAPGEGWVRLEEPIGTHDRAAVARAAARLVGDGLAEADPQDPVRLRLPARALTSGPSDALRDA